MKSNYNYLKNLLNLGGPVKRIVISFKKRNVGGRNMGHSAGDKDKLGGELAQYLQNLNMKTSSYFSEVGGNRET